MDDALRRRLGKILSADSIRDGAVERSLYENDSQRIHRATPDLVLFPENTRQVADIVRLAASADIPVTARGAGTGLSGGAVALRGGWLVSFTRMRRVLSLDIEDRRAWVQPGLVNREVQEILAPHGLCFAPDPSSQSVSTLGGNVAENAGGPHCFKIGVTTQHILGLELVDADGKIHRIGSGAPGGEPLDLVGLFCGSEGALGLVTAIEILLGRLPESVATFLAPFARLEEATAAVGKLVATGLTPAAIEILDKRSIEAVEKSVFRCGYPREAAAVLLVELDGLPGQVADESRIARAILESCRPLGIETASEDKQRRLLWRGRKGAFGALGRLYRDILVQDVCVPISQLPAAVSGVNEIVAAEGLDVANVFHAGDGNLHPNIGFDRRDQGQVAALKRACEGIVALAVELGGVPSGEHGIGIEKAAWMPLALSRDDLAVHRRLKRACDPLARLNPGKLFPPDKTEPPLHLLRDEKLSGGDAEPRWLLPDSVADLRQQLADRRGRAVLVSCAASADNLTWLPTPADRILSTAALRNLDFGPPQDNYLRVGAGLPWADLSAALADRGLEAGFSPGRQDRSVGAVVACDDAWPFRNGLRSPRDRLLGAEAVLADGTLFRSGGVVLKNVTGFDLTRLLCGSRGALAVLTEVTLRLRPSISEKLLILLGYHSREEARRAAALLHRGLDFPAGVLLLPPTLPLGNLPSRWRVGIGLEGSSASLEYQRQRCLDELAAHGLAPCSRDEESGEGPWLKTLREFPGCASRGRQLWLRELRGRQEQLLALLPTLGGPWIWDLSSSRLRVAESSDAQLKSSRIPIDCLERWAAIDERGREAPSRFVNLPAPGLTRRLLRALDPDSRLLPGRWLRV